MALVVAVDNEDRPDQIVRGQHVLSHHAARPIGAAIAPHPDGQVLLGLRRGFDRCEPHLAFEWPAEFDRHNVFSAAGRLPCVLPL